MSYLKQIYFNFSLNLITNLKLIFFIVDVWDRGNSITVTHGFSQCTEINFKDVLNAINVYAFEYSKYPLIISIENHCKRDNQKQMAKTFREIFGGFYIFNSKFYLKISSIILDKLICNFLDPNETELPSPSQLEGRIIIKVRNFPLHYAYSYSLYD
jgi:phosphatidylinositol phospholipase C delta